MPEPASIIDQIQKYILPDRLVEKNIALSPEDSQQVILFYLHLGDARFLELAIDIIPENMKDEKLVYNYLEKTIESIGDFKIIPENTELKLIEVCKRFKDEKYACCILELIAESTNKPIAHSKIIEIALNSEYSEYEITKILKAVAKSSTDHNINSQILDIALKLEEQSDKIYIIEDLLKSTTDEEILQKILVVAIGLMNPILIKMVLMLIIENNNNPNTLRDALELAAVYQFKDIILKAEVIQVKSNFDPKNIRKTIELALNYKEEGETSAILQEVTKLTDDQNTHLEILGIAKQFKKKSHASDLLLAIAQSTTNKTVHLQILEHSYNEDILKSIAKSTKDQDIQLQILEIALGNEYLFEISPILEAIAESTTHEEILTRIRNEAKKFNDKFWTIDLLKATIKSTTELDTLLEMINIAIGINIENYTSDLLVKIANVGRVEIFSEIVNITKNFKDIDYTLSVISALTERYANILIEQSQKDANANPIVFFRQNIEPLIFQFSDLKHRAIIINTFLKSIKTDINANLIDESKESDIDQNNHKPKSKIVPFKRVDLSIPLAKLIRKAQYLNLNFIETDFAERIKKVLGIKSEVENLNGFRGEIVNKLIDKTNALSDRSRLLFSLISKGSEDSFKYLQKFILSLGSEFVQNLEQIENVKTSKTNSTDSTEVDTKLKVLQSKNTELVRYTGVFLRQAVKFNLLDKNWLKFISSNSADKNLESATETLEAKTSDISKIYSIIEELDPKIMKNALEKLNSLILVLDELHSIGDIIEKPKLIQTCLEQNILSPTLYKILRITPDTNLTQILDLIELEKAKAFTNETPSLKAIKNFLAEKNISTDKISETNLLAEIINATFNLTDYSKTRTLLNTILQSQEYIDTHLKLYFDTGLPDSLITFGESKTNFKPGESISSNLLKNLNSFFTSETDKKLDLKAIISKLGTPDLKINLKIENEIRSMLLSNSNMETKFNSISKVIEKYNADQDPKTYYQLLTQVEEFVTILLKDNIDSIFSTEVLDSQKANIIANIDKYFNQFILGYIKTENRKFIHEYDSSTETSDSSRNIIVDTSKQPISFFAKAAVGICTADDTESWIRLKNFFHINLINSSGKLAANIQASVERYHIGEILVLRGFNPTPEFLREVPAEIFLQKTFEYAHKLADTWGLEGVYITESLSASHADSNLYSVSEAMHRMIYNITNPIKFKMPITVDLNVTEIYKIEP